MAYDLEEQEQLDELKAWWNKYGNFVLTVITVVALAFAGWRAWQWWQMREAAQAAAVYSQLQQAAAERQAERVKDAAGRILSEHPRTAYAEMAAMTAAKSLLEAGDAAGAKPMLQWAADKAADEEFRHLAKLRLAGVLLDEKAYDQGLALLAGNPPERFAALYADRRGDLLIAQDKAEEARAAYRQAMERLPEGAPLKEVVRLKLEALGGAAA